jgi:hypothetical protein
MVVSCLPFNLSFVSIIRCRPWLRGKSHTIENDNDEGPLVKGVQRFTQSDEKHKMNVAEYIGM